MVGMIVTMREDIWPLCDKHMAPTKLTLLQSGTLSAKAFACSVAGCTRVYNGSLGYFDVMEDGWLAEKYQQKCPQDGSPMFLENVSGKTENWCCAQINCNHRQPIIDKVPFV